MKVQVRLAGNLPAAILLTALFALLANGAQAQGPKGGAPVVSVVVDWVIEREEAAGQTFVGTLEPRRRSVVGSAVDGRVEEYAVRVGQWVEKDNEKDVIVELRKDTVKIELKNAEAELRFRQAEYDEYYNRALPEDIEQAQAKLDASEAQFRYAKSRHTRTEGLFQRGMGTGITQEDMDLSFSNLKTAEQNQIGAAAALKLLRNWPRPEKLAQAKARLDAQQEAVNQIQDRLEKYTIRAPFDGYVVDKRTEAGEWINRGDAIVEIIEVDPLEVAVSVSENAIPSLQEAMLEAAQAGGLQAVVRVDAVGTKLFTGEVERIVPQADVRSRTFPVKLKLENPLIDKNAATKTHELQAGMICHVTMPIGKQQKLLLVPKDALVLGGPTPRVIVVDKVVDPATKKEMAVAKSVPVDLGAGSGTEIQVWGALKAGDLVVIRGNERLFPGQPLNIVKVEK